MQNTTLSEKNSLFMQEQSFLKTSIDENFFKEFLLKKYYGKIYTLSSTGKIPFFTELEKIEHFFTVKNNQKVRNFILNNLSLLSYINTAYFKIYNYFDDSTQLLLDIVEDPEIENEQELVIFILTNLTPEDAYERLTRLDNDWWLDVPSKIREKMCITLSFK